MAHIVIVSYGITSYLNACFRIAEQLAAGGHRTTFVSSLDASLAVQAQGFDFVLLQGEHAIRQDPERLALERMPAIQRYRRRSALIRVGRRQRQFYVEEREIERVMHSLQPDCLLIDEELPEHVIALAKLGLPMLLLQYFPSTRRAANVPPPDSTLIPQDSPWSRLRIGLVWQFLYLKRNLKYALAPLYYRQTDRRSIMRAIAERDDFDYRARTDGRHAMPVTFTDLPTLFLAAWEFDFPHAVRHKRCYVGPMVCLSRAEVQADAGFAATMRTILEGRAAGDRTWGPLIYCSIGTFWAADIRFLTQVIRAFAGRPNYTLILSVGAGVALEQRRPLPPNVHLFQAVPQLEVLRHADLAIVHGGIGTINECIFLGVPMLVYSGKKVDQNGNAARVVFHGLGLRGDRDKDSPAAMMWKVDQVLAEPRFRANVDRMRAIYLAYHGSHNVVSLIEEALP